MAEPYRPYKKVYSYQEICEMCRNTDLSKARESGLIGRFRPPFSSFFAGKQYTFHFDNGRTLYYRFNDEHSLAWSEDGETYTEEFYDALESTVQNVFFVHHIRQHTIPIQGLSLVIDTERELITWFDLYFGTEESDKNVGYDIHFGWYGAPKAERHCFTDEMTGVVLDWKYTDDFIIRHAYLTPDCVSSPGAPTEDESEYLFRKLLPASFTKIRDGLYTATFVEDGGSEATLLIDLVRLHDVGAFFSMGEDGQLSSYTVGAVAGRGTFGFDGTYAIEPGPEEPQV